MNKLYNEYVNSYCDFLKDLNRYNNNSNEHITNYLNVHDKLDFNKVMLRYLSVFKEHEELLNKKDEKLFEYKLEILPQINISELYNNLTDKQKNKIWTYLQILFIQSELLLNNKETPSPTNNMETSKELEESKEFNPFKGVGSTTEYTVDELFSNIEKISDKEYNMGLESIIETTGIDKMIDLNKLSEQLKNLNKEEIDEATNNIKGLFGDKMDKNTGDLLNNMLNNITSELKKEDISNGNPIKNIMKIAETVATNLKPQINEKNIDMSKLWNSTENIAKNYKDNKGENPFGNNNPLQMLGKMMNMINNPNLNENDCLDECNDMLKQLGMNGMDLKKLNKKRR